MDVYIRPLEEKDAEISYKWRNNPIIWQYTGNKPNKIITLEIERDWIKSVLKRKNEKRFAICLSERDSYIGNVQLTNINGQKAEFHIFIGETAYWGKGISKQATRAIVDYGFNSLNLLEIYLFVNENNIAAIRSYQAVGFMICKKENGQFLMKITKND